MKRFALMLSVMLTCGSLALLAAPAPTPLGEETAKAEITLCGHCGQVKGGEACCKADAKQCGGCQLAKGSPGCCKMEKGKDAKLCACGEIKGGDKCCKMEGREKCSHCNMLKGSPGCKAKCGAQKASHDHGDKTHSH